MADFLFDYPIQPFEQRALVRQQLEANKRSQVIGLESNEIQARGVEIVRQGFAELVESTTDACRVYEASQVVHRDEPVGLDDVSCRLQEIDSGLGEVNETVVSGFTATNLVLGAGFTALYQKLDEGVEAITQSLDEGFANVCETLNEGFEEISSLLEDISGELGNITCEMTQGFEKLGALYEWGFSGLMAQAELQNQQLKQVIKILLKPATAESRDLLNHAVGNYRKRFADEALESFLFLLEEKKYRVVLGTYFPIYQFIGDIYLFDKKEYDKAIQYYELAIKYSPKEAVRLQSLLYLHIGYCHYYKKEFFQAKECVARAITVCESNEAWYDQARYSALNGDRAQSLKILKHIVTTDPKYVFRILREQDFISVRDEIRILLSWIKYVRVFKKLRMQLNETQKQTQKEIKENEKVAIETQVLIKLSQALEKHIKRIDAQMENIASENFLDPELPKQFPQCRKLINQARRLIQSAHLILTINGKMRNKIIREREKEARLDAQQKETQRQADMIRIKAEVESYQKELAEKENYCVVFGVLAVTALILSIILLPIGFYHLVELISFDSEKNKIEIAQKEANAKQNIQNQGEKEAEWRHVIQNQSWWESTFGNSQADKIANEIAYWKSQNGKIYDEITYLLNRKSSIKDWTVLSMVPGLTSLAIFLFLIFVYINENKKLKSLQEKQNYIEQCKDWLRKQP